MTPSLLLLLLATFSLCAAIDPPRSFAFYETFSPSWTSRWTPSEAEEYSGEWNVGTGPTDYGLDGEQGLILSSPARRHAISTKFDTPVEIRDTDFVLQYEVRLHKKLECGGAYVKLLEKTEEEFDTSLFSSETPYSVMFGPDRCGATNKVHFIFRHKNPVSGIYEEKHMTNNPSIKNDRSTHLYTLVVRKDNSFEIFIDQESVKKGSLLEDFSPPVNPSKTIPDPEDVKPEDWVDEKMIQDPDAVKPEDWDEEAPAMIVDETDEKPDGWLDDEPERIPDPTVAKPEDWDDEMDGDFEAPEVENPACSVGCGEWAPRKIPNPAYKGKWSAPLIDNPEYKGEWKAREIPNPSYFEDLEPHNLLPATGLGFELWTMQDQIEFDNIYVGHSEDDAKEFASRTWALKNEVERAHEKSLEPSKMENVAEEVKKALSTLGPVGEYVAENPIPIIVSIVVVLVTLIYFLFRSDEIVEVKSEDDVAVEEVSDEENEEEEREQVPGKEKTPEEANNEENASE